MQEVIKGDKNVKAISYKIHQVIRKIILALGFTVYFALCLGMDCCHFSVEASLFGSWEEMLRKFSMAGWLGIGVGKP